MKIFFKKCSDTVMIKTGQSLVNMYFKEKSYMRYVCLDCVKTEKVSTQ